MSTAPVAAHPAAFLRSHPESYAAAVVVAAWIALLAARFTGTMEHHHGMAPGPAHSMPGMPGMPGTVTTTEAAGTGWSIAALGMWVLMTVAMMGPSALAAARHVAVNSLYWRRQRAVAQFAVAYLGVWTIVGVAALGLADPLPSSTWGLAAVLGAAAVWQVTPAKRRALRACHRAVPLRPRGWAATRSCLLFGLRHGNACVASCWPLMLAMVFITTGHLWWMAAFTGLVLAEDLTERPFRTARRIAVPLGVAAGIAAAVAITAV